MKHYGKTAAKGMVGMKKSIKIMLGCMMCAAMLALAACKNDEAGEPSLYLIPKDYTGWVNIKYDKERGDKTTREGKYVVFKINKDGNCLTKSLLTHKGWATNQYYYVDDNGKRTKLHPGKRIHGATEGNQNKNYTEEHFFVGSAKEFSKSEDYRRTEKQLKEDE